MFRSGFIFILTLIITPLAHARQHVGNGGDAIYCNASPLNQLHGYYSLDYILTYQEGGYHKSESLQANLDHLGELLKTKVPELYLDFLEFRTQILNSSFSKKYVWEPAPFGLIDLEDENIISLLPENCLAEGKAKIIQAVIRLDEEVSHSPKIIFNYVPPVLQSLSEGDGLQASFLFVHEWLWNYSQNVNMNRRIIRYLHSELFNTQSRREAMEELQGMGLPIKGEQYAFGSLQAEIDSAAPGSLIWLTNKTYEEDIHIDKPLQIKVKNPEDRPLLVGTISIHSDHVSVEDLGLDFTKGLHGIEAENSPELQIRNMHFLNESPRGSAISLSNSSGSIEACHFEFNARAKAIEINDRSDFKIQKNYFKNVEQAITLFNTSTAAITENSMEDCDLCINLDQGPFLDDSAKYPALKIEANQITNSNKGIHLKANAPVLIYRNLLDNIRTTGLEIENAHLIEVKENQIKKSIYGIYDKSYPLKDSLIISKNSFIGNTIALTIRPSTTVLSENVFESNSTDIQNHD
ncbi:MAG: right-handed parallel beta-helix repeat-containing protein [Pseudobdellovibrionaceae bacterium]